jgi:hypothetical protein
MGLVAKSKESQTMSDLFSENESEPMSTELMEYTEPSLSLINTAIINKVPPDVVRELVELNTILRNQRAEEAYNVAMHACQQEMPIIVKNKENAKTHSRFASLENVKVKAKPVYTKHGFTIQFHEEDSHLPNHKRTVADCRHNAGHCVKYHIDLPVDGIGPQGNPIGGMNAVQGAISSVSGYGQRVLTCMIFDLAIAETDQDGNSQHELVGEEEIAMLKELIESTDTNLKRFLEWAAIDELKDMSRDFFPAAISQLRRKASK